MSENSKRMGRWFVIAVAIELFCSVDALAVKPPPTQAAYTTIPFLPPDFASTSSGVEDVSDEGYAVGVTEVEGGESVAVHFDIVTDVYTSLRDGLRANGVNDHNETVGVMRSGDFVAAASWRAPSAPPVSLPPFLASNLPSGTRSVGVSSGALAINNDGIVIGGSSELLEVDHGDGTYSYDTIDTVVVWRVIVDGPNVAVDGPIELPPLYAGAESQAFDINETLSGTAQIVGRSGDQAVVWSIELSPEDGTLLAPEAPVPVSTSGASWSTGWGINNLMDISGRMQSDSVAFDVPFVALAGQEAQPLSIPRGTVNGYANDISDTGAIVGSLRVLDKRDRGPGREYAYLWKDNQSIDLNTQVSAESGWELNWAGVISNGGLIGGYGHFDVDTRGFLLIPNDQ
jgi:hypothetical protein